jgi:Anti-sigma-K factor rskA/Putative zinc-finger
VTTGDHTTHKDEVGAYLLGALTDPERELFEAHLATCADCRLEVERLQPAADLLPRSVEQVEPPPGLKASLMEVVQREAGERAGAPAGRRQRAALGERLRGLFGPMRPALAAGVLALGLLVGFGVAQLGGEDSRTITASVDRDVLPDATANLEVLGDGEDGAILRVQGMPSPGPGRVYQAWVMRDGMVEPEPTFEVRSDGGGAGAVPADLADAEAVLVTREQRGGATAPSEDAILTVEL